MKDTAIPARMFTFLNNIIDILAPQDNTGTTKDMEQKPLSRQEKRPERKDFFLYKQVTNCETQEAVGQLSDVSSGGFKLDSLKPVELNKDFHFRIQLDREISEKPLMEFVARSRWCSIDPVDPYLYNVGYQLIEMAPGDLEIFIRMMEKYGREPAKKYRRQHNSSRW